MVLSVAVLFAMSESGSLAVTRAVLVIVPVVEESTVTTMVTVAVLPLAMSPKLQVTMPSASLQGPPWLGLADTKVTPAGKVSVTITPVASEGPVLPIERV